MKLIKQNFEYCSFLEVGCDRLYNCDDSCEFGYCRCSTITDVRFDKFNDLEFKDYLMESLVGNITKAENRNIIIDEVLNNNPSPNLKEYFIDRAFKLNSCYDPNNWTTETTGGYYGEELGGVYLDTIDTLNEDLGKYTGNPDTDIPYLLKREYGFLDSRIVGKSFSEAIIDKSDIAFPQEKHFNQIDPNLYYYRDGIYPYPRGVVIESGGKYKVIDGYHRLKNTKKDKVIVYICE